MVKKPRRTDPDLNSPEGVAQYDLSLDQFLYPKQKDPMTSRSVSARRQCHYGPQNPDQSKSDPVTDPEPKSRVEVEPVFPYPANIPAAQKKAEEEAEILSLFSKIAVNIPMLTLIAKIPSYAKWLREICSNKRKIAEKAKLTTSVASLTSVQMPEKMPDQGMFTIPCVIGDKVITKAFCDPGAGINMLSVHEYESMDMGPLQPTSVTIQVADRNVVLPKGVVENVLVNVNGFIYPVDFYVVDLKPDFPSCSTEVLLGRPFLSTARAKLDFVEHSITVEFFGKFTTFDMSEANPSDTISVNGVSINNSLLEEVGNPATKNPSKVMLCSSLLHLPLSRDPVQRKLQLQEREELRSPGYAERFYQALKGKKHQFKKVEEVTPASSTDSVILPGAEKDLTRQMLMKKKAPLSNSEFKQVPKVQHPAWIGPHTITRRLRDGTVRDKNDSAGLTLAVEDHELKPLWDNPDEVVGEVDPDPPSLRN